jgi:group I intron endonuclease
LRCFVWSLPMGCVYAARNKINGMTYVGKTTRTLEERKQGHLKDALDGSHLYFHKSIRKYGFGAFEWTVLYQDDDNDREWMDWWEMKFIRRLGTKKPGGYNLSDGGEGGTGFKHTEDARRKMSLAGKGRKHTEEHNRKIGDAQRGRKQSEEQRKKNSECHKGLPVSDETRRKMSASRIGYKHSEETRRKIGQSQVGKYIPEEVRRKISEAAKRRPPVSEETRRKISEAGKGRVVSQETIAKLVSIHRGRKRTVETCRKISEALKKRNAEKSAVGVST